MSQHPTSFKGLFPKKPFVPAGEQMAQEMKDNGNSLVPKVHGRVVRISSGGQDWDLSREWRGRELTSFSVRKSQWIKGHTVLFYVEVPSGTPNRLHTFSVSFTEPMTLEELDAAAVSYMVALNMRRID